MSQFPMTINNESGAAFRGDVNSALGALVSISSGTTAPSTTFAYQWWADTTANVLKQRNSANSAWIVRGNLQDTVVLSKTANFNVGAGDYGRVFVCTNSITATLLAVATAADGFWFGIRNDGSGTVAVTPQSGENIDGMSSINLAAGETCFVWCNGSTFKTIGRSLAGTDEKLKVSATDTTNNYLQPKLVAGTGISITKNNSGANETLTIANTASVGEANTASNVGTGPGTVFYAKSGVDLQLRNIRAGTTVADATSVAGMYLVISNSGADIVITLHTPDPALSGGGGGGG